MSLSIDGIQHYTVEEDVWINDKGCFDPSTFVQKHRIDLVEGKEILLKTKFRTLLEIARDNDACWENILTSK